jgi:hypothetical protein
VLIQSNKIFQSYSPEKQEIAKAFAGKRLREYHPNDLRKLVAMLIIQTHANCGFKLDEQIMDMTLDEFVRDLQRYAGLMTFDEMGIAFKKGYKHEFGQFTGLNNSTYWKWINAWLVLDVRLNVRKSIEIMKSMGAVQPELSETEKTEIIKRGVIENFNVYKRGGLLLDAGNISYNFLKERGLITLTEAKKTEIIQNVKSKLRTEALQNKGSKTMQKAIDENVTTVAINIECKREALKEYFKNLVEMEIDINDLI